MLDIGTPAPDFTLDSATGDVRSLGDCMGERGLLVAFICNHCPYVKHVFDELGRLDRDLSAAGVGMVGIMSNDVANYPDDAPDKMALTAVENGWNFPYLHDADQSVAKSYRAACTPDFFLFDARGELVYRGQLDDSRPNSGLPVDGASLREAVDVMLSGGAPLPEQRPSLGCSIKWIPGEAPDWS